MMCSTTDRGTERLELPGSGGRLRRRARLSRGLVAAPGWAEDVARDQLVLTWRAAGRAG